MKRWHVAAAAGVALFVVIIAVAILSGTGEPSAPSAVATTNTPPTSTTAAVTTTTAPPTSTTVAVTTTLAPPEGSERAVATRIIDGDTIEVDILSGAVDTVRLIGINTPESGECFAQEASVALETLLSDEVFTMTSDVSDRDQYDRLLRYLWLDRGVFVNEIMVRGGFAQARDYPPDSQYAQQIAEAQAQAQAEQLGLWAPDACGPESDADLRIIEVFPNAPGPDGENLNGEWVDIVNAGLSGESMEGWVLKDESSRNRYPFPDGYTLDSQAVVRIHTGCGTDTSDTLYWCSDSPVWNNDGDTAFLLDPEGNIHDEWSY